MTVKLNDPLIAYTYSRYFLLDKVDQKRFYGDVDFCKGQRGRFPKSGVFPKKRLEQMQ